LVVGKCPQMRKLPGRFSNRLPGDAAAKPARRPLPRTVWLFGFASLLNDASSEAVFPLLGGFLVTLGAQMGFVGLVLGFADAIAVAIKVGVGRWSDRVRRSPLVIGGYLVAALGRAAIALAMSPWHVLAARSLDRAGKGIRSGPRDAMLADAVPATDRGRAYGMTQSMDHVGAAIGPLVASVCLGAGLSLRATFGVAAGLGLAAPLLLGFKLREIPRAGATAVSAANAPPEAASGAQVDAVTDVKADVRPSAIGSETSTERRSLGAYLAVCGLFALANSSDAFILLRAGDLGWALPTLPLLWLGHHVVKSVTAAIGGSLSDRFPRVVLIAGGWTAYAASYLGFAFATERWHVLALLMFYAVYHGLAEAPERALVSDLAGPTRRGFAFGLYHGVVGLAALPAGVLTGWLWDRAGARAAFGACAATAALAAIVLVGLVRFGPLNRSRPVPAPATGV
jgi:MFS family permease